jgi:hypothetical protein
MLQHMTGEVWVMYVIILQFDCVLAVLFWFLCMAECDDLDSGSLATQFWQ